MWSDLTKTCGNEQISQYIAVASANCMSPAWDFHGPALSRVLAAVLAILSSRPGFTGPIIFDRTQGVTSSSPNSNVLCRGMADAQRSPRGQLQVCWSGVESQIMP